MITIAKYSRIADAQRDASRITLKGIEVNLSSGDLGGPIGGNQPTHKLQIDEEDLPRWEEIREELESENMAENPYSCPACGSQNYKAYTPPFGFILDLFAPRRVLTSVQQYRCLDCDAYFKIKQD